MPGSSGVAPGQEHEEGGQDARTEGLLPLSLTFSPSWGLGGLEGLSRSHVGTSPQTGVGRGGGEAELLEWVGPCQFNIRLRAVRRACGPYLRGRKTDQRDAATCPESHSNPDSGSGPPAGLLSQLGPTDPSHHARARMKGTLWPKRETLRSGRAESGDKRVRLGWKVTQFGSARPGCNRGGCGLEGVG